MFKVGQVLMSGTHGLVTVSRIESKDCGRRSQRFYILSAHDTGITLLAPVGSDTFRLRALVSIDVALEVLDYLNTGTVEIDSTTWNRRYRDYSERLAIGKIDDSAYVLVALRTLSKTQDLSFGERKMLSLACSRVEGEISLVLGEVIK